MTFFMAGSAQAAIRTGMASIMGQQYHNTSLSLFGPRNPSLAQGFIRQSLNVTDSSGQAFAPGSRPNFQPTRDVDYVTDASLVFVAGGIPAASWNGGATFTRWIDFIGVQAWEEIVIQSGTQRLQTIFPEEIMIYILFWLDPVARRNSFQDMGQGTPAQRTASSLADKQIVCELYTLLGLRMHGDPGQGFFIRGLNDYLQVKVRMRPLDQVIESDGTAPTAPATGFYPLGQLALNGYHINNNERDFLIKAYTAHPFAIHFDDQQYSTEFHILGTTTFPASFDFQLTNINQPVNALFVIFRWTADLDRRLGVAGGTRGFSPTNFAGWFNPGGGATNEIVNTIGLFSGNTDLLSTISANMLVKHQHYRDFKGDANVAIPGWSYSHDATAVNAVLGFISFEQIDRPRLRVTLRVPTLGTAHASVNAAATADIGTNSDLTIQVVAFTKNEIDLANFIINRPFN